MKQHNRLGSIEPSHPDSLTFLTEGNAVLPTLCGPGGHDQRIQFLQISGRGRHHPLRRNVAKRC